MCLKKLSPKHQEIALLYIKGEKVRDIAGKFNLHTWSVYRILADPLTRKFSSKVMAEHTTRVIHQMMEDDRKMIREIRKEKERKKMERQRIKTSITAVPPPTA
jgi:hypothetical protein